jgi:proteic killer suppression protein
MHAPRRSPINQPFAMPYGIAAAQLHSLSGDYKGFWAVDVSGNWRIVFRFEGQDVIDVDYLDYH